MTDSSDFKICKTCGNNKTLHSFPQVFDKKYGRYYYTPHCLDCKNQKTRKRRQVKKAASGYSENYISLGIDKVSFEAMEKDWCEICDTPLTSSMFKLDHNHQTNRPRGILCNRCNTLLAGLDDQSFVDSVMKYLQKRDPNHFLISKSKE